MQPPPGDWAVRPRHVLDAVLGGLSSTAQAGRAAVWSTGSLLVQVVDCPAEIVIVAGTKANLAMLTAAAWPC